MGNASYISKETVVSLVTCSKWNGWRRELVSGEGWKGRNSSATRGRPVLIQLEIGASLTADAQN